MRYATRISSFLRFDSNLLNAFQSIGAIEGVDYVDLNHPEHFADYDIEVIKAKVEEYGLRCNAINLRFRDKYIGGESGNCEPSTSQDTIALCGEVADACRRLGGNQMIIWLGLGGFNYSFQIDYVNYWNRIARAFRDVCDYSGVPASIEYKPYGERVHVFIDNLGAAVPVLHDTNRENLGVTLDLCRILMKKESPAFAAVRPLEREKLYNIHLNDEEGSTDDGLVVGTVNLWKTVEIIYYLREYDLQDVIYFGTFPKREKAVEECEADIRMCRRIEQPIDIYELCQMERVVEQNDAVVVSSMMATLLQTKIILMQRERGR